MRSQNRGPEDRSDHRLFLDENTELEDLVFDLIGKETADSEMISSQLDGLRQQIADALSTNGSEPSIDEVRNDNCTTTIRASLLRAWTHVANDPAECICEWLVSGTPAGLN